MSLWAWQPVEAAAQLLAGGGGGGTATPSTFVVVVTFPAPTATGGATTTPATFARTATFPAPTVTGNGVANPATFAATATFPAPTATGGGGSGGTATPGVFVATATFPAPTVTGGGTTTPAVFARTATFPAPTARGGSVTTPSTFVATSTRPAPTTTGGGTTTPAVFSRSAAFPAPTVRGGAVALPSTFAAVVTFPTPSVSGGLTITGSAAIVLGRFALGAFGSTPISQELVDRRKRRGGMEPPTRPAERRDFFDVRRLGDEAEATVTALETLVDTKAHWEAGTYTPTLTNMAIGTGGGATNTASYVFVGGASVGDYGQLTIHGRIVFGTSGATLPGASEEAASLPAGFNMSGPSGESPIGHAVLTDTGSARHFGYVTYVSASTVGFRAPFVSGTQIPVNTLAATTPYTWAVSDVIDYAVNVKVVRV